MGGLTPPAHFNMYMTVGVSTIYIEKEDSYILKAALDVVERISELKDDEPCDIYLKEELKKISYEDIWTVQECLNKILYRDN